MQIAVDKNNQRVSIENADNSVEYFCPICGQRLIIKAKESLAVRPHFAHKSNCLDTWTHDMSEWHYDWQSKFPVECKEIVVKKNGIKHRADILINNTVIEFQHSPIKGKEIKDRNEFYTDCGYNVVWVFDANNKIKNILDKDGSLDPNKSFGLEWKRARKEFENQNHKNVTYFLEYNTNLDTKYGVFKTDTLLYLTEIDVKKIKYLRTKIYANGQYIYHYILRNNFLANYLPQSDEAISASKIIAAAQSTLKARQNHKF